MTNAMFHLKELLFSTKYFEKSYLKLYDCNIISSAAILDAILIISKCSMMPNGHQYNSSSRYRNQVLKKLYLVINVPTKHRPDYLNYLDILKLPRYLRAILSCVVGHYRASLEYRASRLAI